MDTAGANDPEGVANRHPQKWKSDIAERWLSARTKQHSQPALIR